ncbi:hypothetical protein SAMN04488508_10917 [Aquimarina spongiae]|uniref:50S ribosomal protein L29 n=1 Tax=Aquimarina spongiae TaxID=570521 RepID=A0A1M6JE71_9FLAO|nr:hypothetical protein SAMN04488508_10917 [Aquimarina spongiae]
MNQLSKQQCELRLSSYKAQLEKLLDLNVEQLGHFNVKKYTLNRKYLEGKIEYYQSKIDTIKASTIKVHHSETV